ncbi:nodulation protein NfeD [Lysinibacillus sp. KU-BSD001]|uniref:NfeD family protein n=1 Tax=Lysinibacillus sp. KU-BSD001 TaxID=3141328 RepID=UPI0036EC9392
MKQTRVFSWLFMMTLSFLLIIPSLTAFANAKVYHVPIEDNVEKGLLAFLERAFKEAEEQQAEAIVLEIHTPGGYTDAADKIGKLLDQSEMKVIAYINTKAHSAGAFIALHADKIYMSQNATMGAAGIIDGEGNTADEKAESAWFAAMQAAALSSNRDPKYALAMADKSKHFPQYRAPAGKFLTFTADEAVEVKYAEGIANTLEEVLQQAGIEDPDIIDLEPTLAENIARIITNPIVVPILLSIASLGLVLELYSPGFGVPGTMSLSAFGLFFFGHTIAGFAGYETIIMFVIGLILLILELFVPGGIVGIIGGALMIISLLFSGASVTHMAYSIIIAMFIAVMGMVIVMKFFGKKLHVFNKLVLKDATTTEEGYVSNTNRIELIGRMGEALTPLRPAGVIIVDKERIDAVSEGGYIDKGKSVEVIKVEGSRIVVREIYKKMEE